MLTLQASNFDLNQHQQLCVKASPSLDFLVVFFKGAHCNLCYNLLPGFQTAQRLVKGCTFATFDLTDPENMRVRHLALRSTTPLNIVPQIILFFKETPISEYPLTARAEKLQSLERFVADLRDWILEQAAQVKTKVQNEELVVVDDRCEFATLNSKPTSMRYKKLSA